MSTLTQLKKLDWGITTDDKTTIILNDDDTNEKDQEKDDPNQALECIPFLASNKTPNTDDEEKTTDNDQSPEFVSISQLVTKLGNHLPKTNIRVYRVPMCSANKVLKGL